MALFQVRTSVAAVWVEPDNILIKNDIQILSSAKTFQFPALSWPVYAPDLDGALRNVDVSQLSATQKSAKSRLERLLGRLKDKSHERFSNERVEIGWSSEASFNYGFSEKIDKSDGYYYGVEKSGIYKRLAYNLSFEQGDDIERFNGSYLATTFGNITLTYGQQRRHWGASQFSSFFFSSTKEALTGLHVQNNTDFLSRPWQVQVFSGSIRGKPQMLPSDLLAFRFDLSLNDSASFAVSAIKYDGEEHLSNSNDLSILGLDFQFNGSGYNFYTQLATNDASTVSNTQPNIMVGLSGNIHSFKTEFMQSWAIEFLKTSSSLISSNDELLNFLTAVNRFSDFDSFGSKSIKVGYNLTDRNKWLVKANLGYRWTGDNSTILDPAEKKIVSVNGFKRAELGISSTFFVKKNVEISALFAITKQSESVFNKNHYTNLAVNVGYFF
ncbi:hypothetical protein THIOSC15_750026 [uncultured Thiomicrorhabdus sp.]